MTGVDGEPNEVCKFSKNKTMLEGWKHQGWYPFDVFDMKIDKVVTEFDKRRYLRLDY